MRQLLSVGDPTFGRHEQSPDSYVQHREQQNSDDKVASFLSKRIFMQSLINVMPFT